MGLQNGKLEFSESDLDRLWDDLGKLQDPDLGTTREELGKACRRFQSAYPDGRVSKDNFEQYLEV